MAVIVADTVNLLDQFGGEIPGVALTEVPTMMSVPSFDPVETNPIGRRAAPDPPVLRDEGGGGGVHPREHLPVPTMWRIGQTRWPIPMSVLASWRRLRRSAPSSASPRTVRDWRPIWAPNCMA